MASGYGMNGHVMANFQDAYGASQTTSLHAIPIIDESITYAVEQLVEAGMYGRFTENPHHEGFRTIEGTINVEANAQSMGWWLKSILDNPTTTSDTGTQTHVFKPATSDFHDKAALTPLTLEIHRDVGSAFIYYDLIGNQMDLNISNGEFLTMGIGFIGAGFSRVGASSPTFPTEKPFKFDQVSASYNGAAIEDIIDLNISFANGLEALYTLANTTAPTRIKRTDHMHVELSGTMVFGSHSYHQAFENQDESPFVLFFKGDTPHTFKVDIPLLRFYSFDPVAAGPGLVEAAFTAGAMYSTTSATTVEATLVNTQTYY